MKKSREELNRIHKEKCRELKQIRAKMAEDLGVELHQTECTYEGYCSGSCPKCKQEELRLNAAIIKKQLEEADIKRRVAAVGLTTAAALCLSGCNTPDMYIQGNMTYVSYPDELEGTVEYYPEEGTESDDSKQTTTEEAQQTTMELEGEILYSEEIDGSISGTCTSQEVEESNSAQDDESIEQVCPLQEVE